MPDEKEYTTLSCSNCKFYSALNGEWGVCRRAPPLGRSETNGSNWPKTDPGLVCGNHHQLMVHEFAMSALQGLASVSNLLNDTEALAAKAYEIANEMMLQAGWDTFPQVRRERG